jgi:hypothetical protein
MLRKITRGGKLRRKLRSRSAKPSKQSEKLTIGRRLVCTLLLLRDLVATFRSNVPLFLIRPPIIHRMVPVDDMAAVPAKELPIQGESVRNLPTTTSNNVVVIGRTRHPKWREVAQRLLIYLDVINRPATSRRTKLLVGLWRKPVKLR